MRQDGQAWKGQLAIFDDSHIPGLTRLAKGIHEAHGSSTLALVQLYHGGAKHTLTSFVLGNTRRDIVINIHTMCVCFTLHMHSCSVREATSILLK
jgi:2,4-dienoyl-CoA reductase-like NADH-dependent reductase (Old Yellow Enzyme family)